VLTGFWWGNLKATGHLEILELDYRIILKWTMKKIDKGAYCIDIAQSGEK
jgi:hypothetical protein